MRPSREQEIIACCEGIIRNAKKITEDMEHDQILEIRITIEPHAVPVVETKKTFVPRELFEIWNGVEDGE